MLDLQTTLLWGMRISSAIAVTFVAGSVVYALFRSPAQGAETSDTSPPILEKTEFRLASGWPYVLAVLVVLWLQAEVRSARRVVQVNAITAQAQNEVAAAYEAAQQPISAPPPQQGYVYLGQCDKQHWVYKSVLFGWLPPQCDKPIPPGGHMIVSWKGAVIRENVPLKVNGKTKFGAEVARVSAGKTVRLRKAFPVSVFAVGSQYYWGLVDIPTGPPTEH